MLYPKATHRLPHPGLCEPLQDANEEPLDHSWSGSLFLHPKKVSPWAIKRGNGKSPIYRYNSV